jgi:hypothetical protein
VRHAVPVTSTWQAPPTDPIVDDPPSGADGRQAPAAVPPGERLFGTDGVRGVANRDLTA